VSQQASPTQWLLLHSSAAVHAVPSSKRATQLPAWQWCRASQSLLEAQVDGQSGEAPVHRKGEQAGLPDEPAATSAQVPGAAAPLQASQAPSQAVAQQTRSAQCPLAHSASRVHGAPSGFVLKQALPTQLAPGWHCSSPLQLVRQVPLAPQTKLPQRGSGAPAAAATQVPGLASAQLWQGSVQAASQHTPLAQKPERQAAAASQASPSACMGTQAPASS